MEVRRRLGANVRRERERLGLSQEQLAFDSGVHRTYVSGVERGVRNPTVTVVERLAKALKVPASALLDDGPGIRRRPIPQ
jgi:transcriptional regulator with XRE-family HTH domain